jgi:hypothetical protein
MLTSGADPATGRIASAADLGQGARVLWGY